MYSCALNGVDYASVGSVTSPGYPRNYQNLENMTYTIQATALSTVTLSFNNFSTEYNSDLLQVISIFLI